MIFSHAVKQQRFSRNMLSRWFNKLVEKDDYERSDKKKLVEHLSKLSSGVEDNGLEGIEGATLKD